jgi:hypothetical protein
MGLLDDWRKQKFGSLKEDGLVLEGFRQRTQVSCDQDFFSTIYNQVYCIPSKGHKRFEELSVEYTKALLDEFGPKWITSPPRVFASPARPCVPGVFRNEVAIE